MSEIMSESYRLSEILIETQSSSYRPTDGGYLDSMREAGTIMISCTIEKNLRLTIQTTKRCPVDNTITISLKTGAKGMLLFSTQATGALCCPLSIGSKEGFAGSDSFMKPPIRH
jgi:hypothetical protein